MAVFTAVFPCFIPSQHSIFACVAHQPLPEHLLSCLECCQYTYPHVLCVYCGCRCSDKSAVVRGRALADLAEVVDCFAALLAQEPSSEQHQVAEAFVEGLGAAAALTVSYSVNFAICQCQ